MLVAAMCLSVLHDLRSIRTAESFGFDRRTIARFVYFIPGWTSRDGRARFALPVLR